MFDANFYRTVLPGWVMQECQEHPDDIPVVKLHLANGITLDLCHIVSLSDNWFGVRYFRDQESCSDMDMAFLPYELVTLVAVSVHQPGSRRIGFTMQEKLSSSTAKKVEWKG